MSDDTKRILEQQERLRRSLDPFSVLERNTGIMDQIKKHAGLDSRITDFLRQQEKQRRSWADATQSDVTIRATMENERQRKLTEGYVEEVRRWGFSDAAFGRHIPTTLNLNNNHDNLFRMPEINEIGRLAQEAAGAASSASIFLGDQTEIRTAMASIRSPWVRIEEASSSARAFSALYEIGRGIGAHLAYDATYVGALRSRLGDWRNFVAPDTEVLIDPLIRSKLYYDQGFDRSLTDFPSAAFEESLEVVGLSDVHEDDAVDQNEEFVRAVAAYRQLRLFEIELRRFLERVMLNAFGDNWMKHQLPANMLDSWREKCDKAEKAGEPKQPLINYADFSDYRAIIERKDNWNKVFKVIFGRVEDMQESFQRLFPVRIATMHARIITHDDNLLLTVETRRILQAVRKF